MLQELSNVFCNIAEMLQQLCNVFAILLIYFNVAEILLKPLYCILWYMEYLSSHNLQNNRKKASPLARSSVVGAYHMHDLHNISATTIENCYRFVTAVIVISKRL